MSCRVRTGCVNRLSWCQWYVVMRKKKEKKRFKALELSTTVVRLELLSALVLRQEAYGYVIFSFFQSTLLPRKLFDWLPFSIWHARPYRFRPAGGGFLSHALLHDLACVARRAFIIQPRKTAFTDRKFLCFVATRILRSTESVRLAVVCRKRS